MKKKLWWLIPLLFIPSTAIAMVASAHVDKHVHLQNSLAEIDTDGQLKDTQKYYAQDWMAEIPDDRSIFSLSIPGTHDSTMYNGTGIAYTFGSAYAQTQYFNFGNQLNMGIRAFDLRINADGWLVHGITYSKQKFEDAMQEFANFLQQHPTEFVIIRVKDENFDVNNHNTATKANQNYENVLNKFNQYLYNPNGRSFSDLKYDKGFNVKEFRGKMVILNHWHHMVNTSSKGGFMFRSVAYGATIQDKYEGLNSVDEKVSLITNMMQQTSDQNRDDEAFYVNFTSIANSWRPFASARNINPKVNAFLNKEDTLHSLGLVYMDFPGPSLIQAIYKTNFYYSDQDLAAGILGFNINRLTINDIYDTDDKITLKTIDNPKAYQNLFLELYCDDVLVQTIQIAANFHDIEYNLQLPTNQQFDTTHHWSLKAYKKTPDNGWYPARVYNQYTLENINVQKHPYLVEQQELIKAIQDTQRFYNDKYPMVSKALQTQFIEYINNLNPHLPESFLQFTKLKKHWNIIANDLDNLIELLELFDDRYANLNSLELSKVFNSQNVELIRSLKTRVLNQISNVMTADNNHLIDPEQLNNLVREVKKNNSVIGRLSLMVNDIQSLELQKQFDNFLHIYPKLDFAKTNLIQELKAQMNEPNIILEQLFNIPNDQDVSQQARLMIDNFSDQLGGMKIKIAMTTNFLAQCNRFFEQIDYEYLLPFYKQELINALNQSNLKAELIIQKAKVFDMGYKQLKTLVENAPLFSDAYKDKLYQTTYLQQYVTLINQTQAILDQKDPQILTSDFLTERNTEILKTQNILQANADHFMRIQQLINTDSVISDQQKTFLNNHLNQLANLQEDNLAPLITEFHAFQDWYKQIAELIYLNDSQKHFCLQILQNTTDFQSLQNYWTMSKMLNEKMQETALLLQKFNNYQATRGFLILGPEKQQACAHFINKFLSDYQTSNWDAKTVDAKKDELNGYWDLIDSLASIQIAKTAVDNADDLYLFERTDLLADLDLVADFNDLNIWYEKLKNMQQKAQKKQDAMIFKHLSSVQLEHVQTSLAACPSVQEYEQTRQEFIELDEMKARGDAAVERLVDIKNLPSYVNNYPENRQQVLDELAALEDLLTQSMNAELIHQQIDRVQKAYENLERTSALYNHDQAIKKAMDNYNNIYKNIQNLRNQLKSAFQLYSELDHVIADFLQQNALDENSNDLSLIQEKSHDLMQKFIEWKQTQIKLQTEYETQQKAQEEANVFNTYGQNFAFALRADAYNFLPSYIHVNDLQPNQHDETYQITNITFSPNDQTGVLDLSYEIIKNNLVYIKQQSFANLLSQEQIQAQQLQRQIREKFKATLQETNTYIEALSNLNAQTKNDINVQDALTNLTNTYQKSLKYTNDDYAANEVLNEQTSQLITGVQQVQIAVKNSELKQNKASLKKESDRALKNLNNLHDFKDENLDFQDLQTVQNALIAKQMESENYLNDTHVDSPTITLQIDQLKALNTQYESLLKNQLRNHLKKLIDQVDNDIAKWKHSDGLMYNDPYIHSSLDYLVAIHKQAQVFLGAFDNSIDEIIKEKTMLLKAWKNTDEAVTTYINEQFKTALIKETETLIKEVQTWVTPEWQGPIETFIKRTQAYIDDIETKKVYTKPELLNIQTKIRQDYFLLQSATQKFYESYLKTNSEKITFEIIDKQNHKNIDQFEVNDFKIMNDSSVNVQIKTITPNTQNNSLIITFDTTYQGHQIHNSYEVQDIPLLIIEPIKDEQETKPISPDVITPENPNTTIDQHPDEKPNVRPITPEESTPINQEKPQEKLEVTQPHETQENNQNVDGQKQPDESTASQEFLRQIGEHKDAMDEEAMHAVQKTLASTNEDSNVAPKFASKYLWLLLLPVFGIIILGVILWLKKSGKLKRK
ncbi:hypothetical protein OF376_01980 [Ureaplasma miroungigenitalium]|uniref:1-phosphatidylinositol phosphodiesterase n=1 Tax=Ureaplasma miroungigenitalium TaxID=1042321 RepID=A0ABT3BNE0_9BACT|nr:hypothetical protein [Ureaplasma miroungigenitalium]MCV3728532.1 hypothetical protein [Ureaplasma miroungigenitalium]